MVKDKTKTKEHKEHQLDAEAYNQWCKEFHVGSGYIKPTQYYRTDYHYEQQPDTTIGYWLSVLFKRLTNVI